MACENRHQGGHFYGLDLALVRNQRSPNTGRCPVSVSWALQSHKRSCNIFNHIDTLTAQIYALRRKAIPPSMKRT